MVLVSALLPSVKSVLCMLKLIPPLGVVLGSARMDFQKWFHRGVAPALSVCVTLLFNTLRRLYMYIHTSSTRTIVLQGGPDNSAAYRPGGAFPKN